MRNIFQLLLIILFSCASQGSPPGGPVDNEGPIILKFSSDIIDDNQPIIISFNEIIKPSSAIQSININGNKNFKIQTKYNKVILRPIDSWPDIVELNINRNIEDYQGNIMDSPISKIFRKEMAILANGVINGQLINFSDENIHEIGLYEIKDNDLFFIKKTQANKEGAFKFQNIESGDYRVCAIEGTLSDFNNNYRFSKYGIQSDRIFINSSNYNFNIKILMDQPIPKNQIIAAEMINGNFAVLTLSDGSKKNTYLTSNNQSQSYFDADSVSINIYNENRFGRYLMEPFNFLARIDQDTISASVDKYYIENNILFVDFSEPVKILKKDVFFNNNGQALDYNMINPFEYSLDLKDSNKNEVSIKGYFISDFNNNLSDSLITINIIPQAENVVQKFGSLKGKVNYDGDKDVVVRLINSDTDKEYHVLLDNDSNFMFDKVIPGLYTLDSYENKLSDFKTYYSGEWEPFNYAAKFSIYPETVDIRAHWVIEGVEIDYD